MSNNLRISQLVVHYVDNKTERLELAQHEQDVSALESTITDFLLSLVDKVWKAPDKGSTRSGYFAKDDQNQLLSSVAGRHLNRIIESEDDFFDASLELARLLYQESPGTASAGLLAVLRLIRTTDDAIFVALLKIRHKDENFVKVLDDVLTQLEVEQVENMLLQKVQKGAIVPHPTKDNYDIKIIDVVASDDPAIYFVDKFLGCVTKKSDEHQVKKLLPELQKYAHEADLTIRSERFPQVIATLQEQETNITSRVIAEVVHECEVFSPDTQLNDLDRFITQASDLGDVDIPPKSFSGRGRTHQIPRLVTYSFFDPNFRNVKLSGPPGVFNNILSVDGDTVTFQLRTTRDGYNVTYE